MRLGRFLLTKPNGGLFEAYAPDDIDPDELRSRVAHTLCDGDPVAAAELAPQLQLFSAETFLGPEAP